jgi:hypothetical protein
MPSCMFVSLLKNEILQAYDEMEVNGETLDQEMH